MASFESGNLSTLRNILLLLAFFSEFKYCSQQGPSKDCVPDWSPNGFPYDAIVFDLYGTLLDYSTINVRIDALNLPKDFFNAWYVMLNAYSWLRTGMGSYRDYNKLTWDALEWTIAFYKVQLTKKQKNYLMNSWIQLKPLPDVKSALKEMKKATPNLYVFSDQRQDKLEKSLKSAGLYKFFKKVVSSDGGKALKPSTRAYAYLQQTLCIRKEKVLFVSANSWESQGAKSYEFRSVWISSSGTPQVSLGFPPDATFMSLKEFVFSLQIGKPGLGIEREQIAKFL